MFKVKVDMKGKGNVRDLRHESVDAYSALARIYDEVMCHVDYQLWVHFAIEMLVDHGLEFRTGKDAQPFLECGCGTGTFAMYLALMGFDVTAFDASEAMVEVAKSKTAGLENPPRFSTKEFLSLNETEKYQVVFCLYDSVNYLLNRADLQLFFGKVKSAVVPGGYFLFDICTIANSKSYFSERTQIESGVGYWFEREMKYNSIERIQENRFSIEMDDQPGKIFTEVHKQKIYSVKEIRSEIANAGLNLLKVTDGFTRKPPNHRSLRIHFLCRKDLQGR